MMFRSKYLRVGFCFDRKKAAAEPAEYTFWAVLGRMQTPNLVKPGQIHLRTHFPWGPLFPKDPFR